MRSNSTLTEDKSSITYLRNLYTGSTNTIRYVGQDTFSSSFITKTKRLSFSMVALFRSLISPDPNPDFASWDGTAV